MSAEQRPQLLHIDNTPQLVAIYGPMYSGKSSELVERITIDAEVLEYRTVLVKPIIDDRYAANSVVSHSGKRRECVNVNHDDPAQIISHVLEAERDGKPVEVVGIDEVQFFGPQIVDVVEELIAHGKRVYIAGLPTDFRDMPFGQMGGLITRADIHVPKLAKCMYREDEESRPCGQPASKTQRIVNGVPAKFDDPILLVGATEAYQARCRTHHEVPGRPERILVYEAPREVLRINE